MDIFAIVSFCGNGKVFVEKSPEENDDKIRGKKWGKTQKTSRVLNILTMQPKSLIWM